MKNSDLFIIPHLFKIATARFFLRLTALLYPIVYSIYFASRPVCLVMYANFAIMENTVKKKRTHTVS